MNRKNIGYHVVFKDGVGVNQGLLHWNPFKPDSLYTETSLNQTLSKLESPLNLTLSIQESPLDLTLSIQESPLNLTLSILESL